MTFLTLPSALIVIPPFSEVNLTLLPAFNGNALLIVVCNAAMFVALALPLSPAYAVDDVSPSASEALISAYAEPLHLYVLLVAKSIYIFPDSAVITVVCELSL